MSRFVLLLLASAMLLIGQVQATEAGFVHAKGQSLVLDGKPFQFKAICFSNAYIYDNFDPKRLALHHSEIDLKRTKGLGFNAIRFGLNGNWFEQNPSGFFTWLDTNIHWAEKYGVKLILDLHVPIGGFWLDPTSDKVDFSLWDKPSVAQKNIDFWVAIAKRYARNTTIAGYDLLNEPVTTDTDGKQWQKLAAQMAAAIRRHDKNHLLIVERLYGVNKSYGVKNASSQFLINDNNVLYDFHFYEPIAYTHQGASWLAKPLGEGGKYPDENELTPTGFQKLNVKARIKTTRLKPGDTDWHIYKSKPIKLKKKRVIAGAPQMAIHGGVTGNVVFDDIEVIEIDKKGNKRTVLKDSLSDTSLWQWYEWQKHTNNTVSFKQNSDEGFADKHSLSFSANATPAKTLAGWSSDRSWHEAKPGYRYQIVGKMKGQGVRYKSKKSYVGFELNFFEPGKKNMPIYNARNKAYLRQEITKFSAFGQKHNVPVSILETGVVSQAFGASGLGGAAWYRDMLALLKEMNISYAFWNYHGDQMGVFQSSIKQPPAKPNRELIDLLISEQNGRRDWAYSGFTSVSTASAAHPADLTKPPKGLAVEQVPQFVVIGFDDNTSPDGINWALDLFQNKRNPRGRGNSATFDGSPARVSFFMNSAGFSQWIEGKPSSLVKATKRIAAHGHELGNHTVSHHADLNTLPWQQFQNRVKNLSDAQWRERIVKLENDMKRKIGVQTLAGFRAPYLAYNQAMLNNLASLGYRYDTSVEEGYGEQFDGTNFRWPYKMDNGVPGHNESWWGSKYNEDAVSINGANGLWQLPNYVLIVPSDHYADRYGFKPGLWNRMKQRLPNLSDNKITGFDYNLWVNAELSKPEVLGILKYNLDLRLTGNRAPFMFGAHSQYYTNDNWARIHAKNATTQEMQETIAEFVDYALSRPEVRLRSAVDVIDWMENPTALSR